MGFLEDLAGVVQGIGTEEGNGKIPEIMLYNTNTPTAFRKRDVMMWRVPGLGYVEMYMNPQELKVTEKKILTKTRTKGGFVIQYWGEDLINVNISGSTGSSGVEGINILRRIYRAEQESFKIVAQKLSENVTKFSDSLSSMSGNSVTTDINSSNLTQVLGGSENQTISPTLGSLAVSIEMFYQGWLFKGFFESFDVTEGVSQGVGIFNYNMVFTVLERRGFRTNFMPWHRSPAQEDSNGVMGYNHADTNSTPYNFSGEYIPSNSLIPGIF